MTETKDSTGKTVGGAARKPLTLQRTVESGQVRQNFSHGRSKAVVVEKKKTRKIAGAETVAEKPLVAPLTVEPRVTAPREPVRAPEPVRSSQISGSLSVGEQDARARALAAARERDESDRAEAVIRAEERAAEAALAAKVAAAAPSAPVAAPPVAASPVALPPAPEAAPVYLGY